MSSEHITTRYRAYCDAHNATVDEMRERNDREFPGGRGCGYILWISARWQEWRKAKGYHRDYPLSQEDHDEFDAWLATLKGSCT